ncbi:MAG: DUF3540 domain-containing protein [Aquabacterium sp.]|nr:DUF3540 domain-containing protein [Aquabacterium sp.]
MNTPDLTRQPDTTQGDRWADALGTQALAVPFVATVVTALGDECTVRSGTRMSGARRALGCLVLPEAGDEVACWRVARPGGDDAVYILGVLARPTPTAATATASASSVRLQLGPGATLGVRDGELAIEATQGVRIDATQCALDCERLEVRAGQVSVVYRALQSVGELCQATLGQLRLVGQALTTVFDHQSHHAQQYRRSVEGVDALDAEVVDHRARELMRLQGRNLLSEGDRLVKVRGTQIHLG